MFGQYVTCLDYAVLPEDGDEEGHGLPSGVFYFLT